ALHQILGNHATQRGQNVDEKRLRFDFSHFQKLSEEEVAAIEAMVNQRVRENIPLEEDRNVPIQVAQEKGAMMLFGEKYGEEVRVITFDKDFSMELCGGTHVQATGEIGNFKIVAESAVAAGVRRIEAVTGPEADAYLLKELEELDSVRALFPNPKNLAKQVADLQEENKALKKQVEQFIAEQASGLQKTLSGKFEDKGDYKLLTSIIDIDDPGAIKTLAFNLEKDAGNAVIVFGADIQGKPRLFVLVSKDLVGSHNFNAGNAVRELAKNIKGGGGGQPFYAEAGGADVSGLDKAIAQAREMF
ncbi:MAG: alanine--tRNA ligase, partial [Saprospiraceae bacterium]|nr:alanine--tRNA ligase [Saprospiraceae bacterium]